MNLRVPPAWKVISMRPCIRVPLTTEQVMCLESLWRVAFDGETAARLRRWQWIKRRRRVRAALRHFLRVHLEDDLPKHFPQWWED